MRNNLQISSTATNFSDSAPQEYYSVSFTTAVRIKCHSHSSVKLEDFDPNQPLVGFLAFIGLLLITFLHF